MKTMVANTAIAMVGSIFSRQVRPQNDAEGHIAPNVPERPPDPFRDRELVFTEYPAQFSSEFFLRVQVMELPFGSGSQRCGD